MELAKNLRDLKQHLSSSILTAIGVIAFLVIPITMVLNYNHQKNVLNEALAYIYTPEYGNSDSIDTEALSQTLNVIRDHKNRNGGSLFGSHLPYISTYYNWMVLDNLTLSDAKMSDMERIFFDAPPAPNPSANSGNKDITLTDLTSESEYDPNTKTWRSWVHLEITNESTTGLRNAEYATTITLPVAAWISDYYLYVGDRKEMGILAEKKAAKWIFSQIRNVNRDPGILYYLTGNKVAFKVFPFLEKEVRRTGIELIHKEPIAFQIDDKTVQLGTADDVQNTSTETDTYAYISYSDKKNLKRVVRTPYLHFVIDGSEISNQSANELLEHVSAFAKAESEFIKDAKVSIVSSRVDTYDYEGDWQQAFLESKKDEGFFLDRAIKSILLENYGRHTETVPVIVVITKDMDSAIVFKDFSDYSFTFPESEYFYHYTGEVLNAHSLLDTPKFAITEDTTLKGFNSCYQYTWKDGQHDYIAINYDSALILKDKEPTITETSLRTDNWEDAVLLHSQWQRHLVHPEQTNRDWVRMVRNSFRTSVMTPVTSYIALENEAQKAMLKKKQEQLLSGNPSLDAGEDVPEMTEPSTWILLLLFGGFLWVRYKRRKTIHS